MNRLQAEVEEQRTHKQMAMVENEHLRMEVEALRSTNVANIGAQIGFKEADGEFRCEHAAELAIQKELKLSKKVHLLPNYTGRAQAAELRFTQLKERHAELVSSHADLMKKVHCRFFYVYF